MKSAEIYTFNFTRYSVELEDMDMDLRLRYPLGTSCGLDVIQLQKLQFYGNSNNKSFSSRPIFEKNETI